MHGNGLISLLLLCIFCTPLPIHGWWWSHSSTDTSNSKQSPSSSASSSTDQSPSSSSTSSSNGDSLLIPWHTFPMDSNYHHTIDPGTFKCSLDPKLNESSFGDYSKEIGEMWGAACGRNRGIFVLDPPDGHTYGCGNMPTSKWGISAAAELTTLAAKQGIKVLGEYIDAVYKTSIVKGPSACDFNTLSMLACGREEPWKETPWYKDLKAPIRSVNIGGLFVLEQWILPSFIKWNEKENGNIIDQESFSKYCGKLGNPSCEKLKKHWKEWYTKEDFQSMKNMGLNTIRLPVGWWYFAEKVHLDPSPYIIPDEDLYDESYPITKVLQWANEVGLKVIFDLHGAPGSQNGLDNSGESAINPNVQTWGTEWLYSPKYIKETVSILEEMARYIKHLKEVKKIDNIILLQLVNEPWVFLDMGMVRDFYILAIGAVRKILPEQSILLHDSFRGDLWPQLLKYFPYGNIYMDTHLYHGK